MRPQPQHGDRCKPVATKIFTKLSTAIVWAFSNLFSCEIDLFEKTHSYRNFRWSRNYLLVIRSTSSQMDTMTERMIVPTWRMDTLHSPVYSSDLVLCNITLTVIELCSDIIVIKDIMQNWALFVLFHRVLEFRLNSGSGFSTLENWFLDNLLEDSRWGTRDTPTYPTRPISFIFRQFSTELLQHNSLAPPRGNPGFATAWTLSSHALSGQSSVFGTFSL